jgi:hypothetical protein
MYKRTECPECGNDLTVQCVDGTKHYMCENCLYLCKSFGNVRGLNDALLWISNDKMTNPWICVQGIPITHKYEFKGKLRDFYSEVAQTCLSLRSYVKAHPGDCEKLSHVKLGEC